jgi:hypothetical protein
MRDHLENRSAKRPMMRFILLALSLPLFACGRAPTIEESYSGPWREPTSEVMTTLAKNQVRGCGEFYLA